jgi:prepilin peptidase dependent protein B
MRMMMHLKRQAGLTFVEVLVGLAVGVIVIGGGLSIYASSVRSGSETLLASKLNQELGALMLVMTNDIRRAGYWATAIANRADQNPFNLPGSTALAVVDNMVADAIQPPTGQGSCITYAYDATYIPGNIGGTLESNDLFGFRLNGTTVQMRQSGMVDGTDCVGGSCNTCTNGVWMDVTDPNVIEITQLTFDLSNSQCLNSSEPNEVDDNGDGTIDDRAEQDCYVTVPPIGSNEVTMETREVTISLTGRLAADSEVQASATHSVRVRNDVLRIW